MFCLREDGVPAILGMRRKAKESEAKSAIKDIGSPMAQYMDEATQKKESPPKDESPPKKPGG